MSNSPHYSNPPQGAGEPRPSAYPTGANQGARGTRKQVERAMDVLYRRRWIVIGCFLIAGLVTAAYVLTLEPVYETSAAVMVDLNRMPGGQQETVVGNTPFVRSDRSVGAELFIIQNSHYIAQRVNERLRTAAEEGQSVSFPARGHVSFSQASRNVGSAIRVAASSPDPNEAALLANAYAEEYVHQTVDASRSYIATSRQFLEDQEGRRRAELREAEDALEAYLRRTGTIGLNQEGAGLVNRIVSVEAARDEALIDMQMRQAQVATLERELERINPQLAQRMASDTDMRIQALQSEIAELEMQRRQIESREAMDGTGDRARLERIERRAETLQAEMLRLSERRVQEVMQAGGMDASSAAVGHAADLERRSVQERIALEGLQARVNSMNQRLNQYQGQLGTIPELSTDLARLERDKQHAEQMYQYVVQRLQDTRIAEESEPGYARIIRHASVPSQPVGPDQWRSLGFGMLFGLLIGVSMALLRDRLDTRIYKLEQLKEHGLPLLGVIPNLNPAIVEQHGKAKTAEREGEKLSTSLITLHNPLAPPSEAYRHLRTSVQFSRMDQVVKKVLVTSAGAGDGKSTTVANLAVTMAQARRRTIVLDADMRRPNQHTLFGKSEAPGLSQLLTSSGMFARNALDQDSLERWLATFQSKQHPSLYVVPAGDLSTDDGSKVPDNPAELVGSPRMRQLLDLLTESFDVVIIDAPPVLAATDAVLLSTQADATVLVARAGETKEADLEHSIQMLREVGGRMAGILLNGFDLSMAYGYRYSYGHYTKYGPYSKYTVPSVSPRSARPA